MLSFLFFEVKAQQYFVRSSYTFLYKKTLLKIWLNSGLNLTIFRGTLLTGSEQVVNELVYYLANGANTTIVFDVHSSQ